MGQFTSTTLNITRHMIHDNDNDNDNDNDAYGS